MTSPVLDNAKEQVASATSTPVPTLSEVPPVDDETPATTRVGGLQFWSIFASLMVVMFLSALDFTSVSTALPTIVSDLHGQDFVWVGSAFTLGSTAFLPLSGGLAQVFGRRPVVLGSVALFALGSGICGGATSMSMLIAGRTIQGVGGGGILTSTEIIVADLVPLKQRGPYVGLVGGVWAIASAIGPPVGGAFSEKNWRWLFYLNLPLSAIAMALVFFFFQMKAPEGDSRAKMKRLDWTGNLLVVAGTTAVCVAVAWGGVTYAWASYQVLVTLILGVVLLAGFLFYEAKFATEPVVPWQLLSNRTSFFGYVTVLVHGMISTMVIYFFPVYFQGTLLQSPVESGVSFFGNAFTIAPGAAICGITIALFHKYKPQNFIGWVLTLIGVCLLSTITIDSPKGHWAGFQVLEGLGLGVIFTAPKFAILAHLPITENAHALALFIFARSFAQTFGVTIGAAILQNQLKKRLPEVFLAMFPSKGVEIAYAAIPEVPSLPEPLQREVRTAFADSVRVIWYATIGLAAFGLLCVFAMKEVSMHDVTDKQWGIVEEERPKESDTEKA